MARKKTTREVDPNLAHNSAARGDYIRSQFQEWYQIDCDIVAAREKHLKPLTEARTKLRKNVSADLTMKQEDLKVAYAAYKRRQDSMAFDDEGEADQVHDTLRELFKALAEGETLDFLAALGEPIEEKAEKPGFLHEVAGE